MEESVGEEERRETMVKARQADERVEASGRGGGEPGGFLSAMASKIGAAMAGGGNENSGEDGGTVDATAASSGEAEEKEYDGHGGGGIFRKFMSTSYAPSRDSGGSETEEVKGEENAHGAGDEQGGILSAMASRIGMAMSGANGNGNGHRHSAADDAKTNDDVDHRKSEEEDDEKWDEANGAGILSTMASKIGVAMLSANSNGGDHGSEGGAEMSNGNAVDHVNGDEKDKGDDPSCGILGAVASKISVAMSGANDHGGSGDDAKTNDGDASGSGRVEEKGGGANGGLVDHIRSSLPSEDQALEADEASLLFAIIED